VPLTINCWPSVSGGDSYVNIEYEAHAGFDLQNVVISIPCHTAPRVNEARRPRAGRLPCHPAHRPAPQQRVLGRARARFRSAERSGAGGTGRPPGRHRRPAQGRAVGPAPHSRVHIAVMSLLRTTCRG